MLRLRTLKHKRGQSLVEFALIVPLLLLIVIVIFDLGRAVYAYHVVAHAAREGARFATTHRTGDIVSVVRNAAVGLNLSELTVSVGPGPQPDTIQVEVIYLFYPVTGPVFAILHPEGYLPLSSRSTMYIGY